MKIELLCQGIDSDQSLDPAAIALHSLASVRLRLPGVMSGSDVVFTHSDQLDAASDRLYVGKPAPFSRALEFWRQKISLYLSLGKKVIVDYTDNHLLAEKTVLNSFYQSLLGLPGVTWISSSQVLADTLKNKFNQEARVIDDCCEVSPLCSYRLPASGKEKYSFLWHGHSSNLDFLVSFIESVSIVNYKPYHINFVGDHGSFESLRSAALQFPGLTISFWPWSLKGLKDAADTSDFSLLPGDLASLRKAGVGINRLCTSLALGLPTLATPYDSYMKLRPFFLDINLENFTQAINGYYDMRLDQGKLNSFLNMFSKDTIAEQWMAAIFDD